MCRLLELPELPQPIVTQESHGFIYFAVDVVCSLLEVLALVLAVLTSI